MTKGAKLKLLGWSLFALPLAVQIANIVLAVNRTAMDVNRGLFGIILLWSQLLVFPQILGIVLVMYAEWKYRTKK